jgi:DNA primase
MSVWEEIKHRLKVEDVIGEYIETFPAGAYYKCICPFHNERTPSMMISPDRGIWHCFGCGAGGDIFQFVQDFEQVTPKEALSRLAKKANVSLEKSPKKLSEDALKVQSNLETGYELLEWTKKVFHKVLIKILQDREHAVTKYCLARGLSQQIIEQFEIGYAPSGQFLCKLATQYNLDTTLLVGVGVLKRTEQGHIRDKFTDRLMIPIMNAQSKTVGFTGRVLPNDTTERPKYLNSSASVWFNKSELWFGMNLAKRAIHKYKKAVLVEGNMDVISAFAHGINHTVASQGTSVTTDQLQNLLKVTRTIQIAFDNDTAGITAGEKLFQEATRYGFTVDKVVIPHTFKDLDEFLFSQDYTEGDALRTIPYISFILDTYKQDLINSNSHEKKDAIEKVLKMIASVDQITAELYLNELSALTSISKQTLETIFAHERSLIKPISVEEVEQDQSIQLLNSPETGHLRVAFQKLMLSNINPSLLKQLYRCLVPFIKDFHQKTYDQYYVSIEPELQLMKDSGEYSYIDKVLLFDSLLLFLDQNITKFILDSELKAVYQQLKAYNFE